MANSLPVSTAQIQTASVETLALRTGHVVEAVVYGTGQGGTTKLAIGDVLVEAALSVRIQPGAVIRILIQGTGQNTRLTVLPTPPHGQASQTPPQAAPLSPANAQPGSAAIVPRPVVSAPVPAGPSIPASPGQAQAASAPQQQGIAPNAVPLRPAGVVTSVQAPPPDQVVSGRVTPAQITTAQVTPAQGASLQNVQPGPGQGAQPPVPSAVPPVALAQQVAASRIEPGTVLRFEVQGAGANARPVLVPVATPGSDNAASKSQPPAQPVLPALASNPLAQALVQTAQTAVLRQDSIGVLLTNLAGLGTQLSELPEPVAQAGARLLSGQLDLSARPLDGAGLKEAILRSGTLLENTLLKSGAQAPPQGDLKSVLLNFRNALRAWLGGDSQPAARNEQRPPPPTSGAYPRTARPASQSPALVLPNLEAGAKLLGQAEAALARMRLTQISSLPEAGARPAQGSAGPASELNIELPLLHGGELGVGQFQISRDGGKDGAREQNGEWKMRFSINFSQTGEVGATVSLRGGKTGVMLWAEREETADILQESQGELADSLAARGLEPGTIRCRHGHPPQAKKPVGAFMDNCS